MYLLVFAERRHGLQNHRDCLSSLLMSGVVFFCAREPCEIGKINEVYQEKEKNPQASGEGLRTNFQHRFCATAHFRFTILCDVFFSQRMIDASLCMTQTMNGWSASVVSLVDFITRGYFCKCSRYVGRIPAFRWYYIIFCA